MIDRCVEKIAKMEEKKLEDGDYSGKSTHNDMTQDIPGASDAYGESVDYNASQESVESFATKLGITQRDVGGRRQG